MTKSNDNLMTGWFALNGKKALPFQNEVWENFFDGRSGLVSVPTGAGKTYAAYLPALAKLHANYSRSEKGIRILYITPLRALAKNLEQALKAPIEDLNLPYRVEKRTGDTTATVKAKQKKTPPEVLLTTPESLALMLSDMESAERFKFLETIIVDEWHELLSSKRGVLLELCLSRIKKWSSSVQIWGLTATIGNKQEAAQVCVGIDRIPKIITAVMDREVILKTILPDSIYKLPWAGYMGIKLLPFVLKHLSPLHPTLIFTNTRSQAEKWHQAILDEKPEWKDILALHHSAIDKKTREKIEEEIRAGELSFVVCTSSLDLGVDLPKVERVIQIGSPKSISRLIQRAGRSSHKPLTPCHIAIVPTHALEVVELKAYRKALQGHVLEERKPLQKCYDVLLQHIITCAIGGGFTKEQLFNEIKTTACFEHLSILEYENCLEFLMSGGKALTAYPEYSKLNLIDQSYRVVDRMVVRRHKMNIGTITSDAYVPVKLLRGKAIGYVEESFLTNLKVGDSFLFAGKHLKLVQYRDMTAYVRLSNVKNPQTTVWRGSRLPFSAPLGKVLRQTISSKEEDSENPIFSRIIELQHTISHVPNENELLIEILKSREGWHLFIYPFEGKTLHEGLAKLIAHRLSKTLKVTFTLSCNDYGFEILSNKPWDNNLLNKELFSTQNDREQIRALINLHEAGKGCFRDISRIAGLIFQGFPGKHKSNRQVQISAGLIYDVFEKYDPDNLLLKQAKTEVLEGQFEQERLHTVLNRISNSDLVIKLLPKFSPFCLPLYIERVSDRLSTETLAERLANIQSSWEKS
ncbi:MAG: ligase-associated DNA damage response DEXH box helicase [Candidatus Protochlamydia sp.]|nr:ligase-associated DNA damage response DEXH box helicase [Candidatus Protochlamydia sp.]